MSKPNTFRDSIVTIDDSGNRVWLYPKKPKGSVYQWRQIVAVVWIALFFGLPFAKIGGQPAMLFDLEFRKFYILGSLFWPQDFFMFALFFITLTVGLILFTVLYGRIFCGWVCPQTIFMEMIFRKVEWLIEGTPKQQRALNAAPWGASKIAKKTIKITLFVVMSIALAAGFIAFFMPPERFFEYAQTSIDQQPSFWFFFLFISGFFIFVYVRFREQICSLVCPYGRIQGVLLDQESLLISYDFNRGEPRGKEKSEELGDCIDCHQCVDVCPTGIDIRNGTQLECINCTACIDACNAIMRKIHKPEGLVRYASHDQIQGKKIHLINPRSIAYTAVFFLLAAVLTYFVAIRTDLEINVFRSRGEIFYETADSYRNLYNYKIMNKTFEPKNVSVRLISPVSGKITLVGEVPKIPGGRLAQGVFYVDIPKAVVDRASLEIQLEVYEGDEVLDQFKTNFLGPIKK